MKIYLFIIIIILSMYIYLLSLFIYSIYILFIFTNLISTSIHGTRKKQKNPGQEQEIKISRITVQRKKKKVFWGKKERKDQPHPTP